MAAAFTNLYYKRAVGTAKACYICHKPTTTVLATLKTEDFLYACNTHLSDRGFASLVGDTNLNDGVGAGGAKTGLSPEEIAKVKAEWEERQKEKTKAKEKNKETDKDSKEGKNSKGEKDAEKNSSVPGAITPPSASATPTPPTPTHQRYALHRDIFALRLAEHRRRRQAARAKELAPRLPGAPVTPLPPP